MITRNVNIPRQNLSTQPAFKGGKPTVGNLDSVLRETAKITIAVIASKYTEPYISSTLSNSIIWIALHKLEEKFAKQISKLNTFHSLR